MKKERDTASDGVNEKGQAVELNLALQRVLNNILKMAGEEDWTQVAMSFREEVEQFIRFDGCGIIVADPSKDAFFVYDVTQKGQCNKGHLVSPLPHSLVEAMRTGQPVYRCNRLEMEAFKDNLGPDRNSVLDVPFAGGTIAVNSEQEDAFGNGAIGLLQQFAPVMSEAHRRMEDLRELERKDRQLQQAQKMEALGQLTAGIAHNFNNLLQGILVNLELIRSDATAGQLMSLDLAKQGAIKAGNMIKQLMLFSRSEEQTDFVPCALHETLNDLVGICRQIFDRLIVLDLSVPEQLPPILGDANQLEQVFLNLLVNARDAFPESEQTEPMIRISVTVEQYDAAAQVANPDAHSGTYVCVVFEDNGSGMDEATLGRIFDPFFTTKDVDKGTGLGLATAYGIIRNHLGWIDCQSVLGRGTTFAVYLPVTDQQPAVIEPLQGHTGQEQHTVLLIDDDEPLRCSMERFLLTKGYQVLTAADGLEGLKLFSQHPDQIDLVLLDLNMPKMSGHEVLRVLLVQKPLLKVLIFSGYTVDSGQLAGAADIIGKPFQPDEVVERIQRILADTSVDA